MKTTSRALALFLAAAALSAAGCGPVGYAVSVLVTADDGSPLDGATVTLQPEDGTKGMVATGMTGADGKANLSTSAGDRVLPGKYKVLVTKTSAPGAMSGEIKPGSPEYQKMMMGGLAKSIKNEVAPEYSDLSKTPLSVTVPAAENPVKLSVKKAAGGNK